MSTMDDALRRALREIADDGRPVDLGRAALAGARRRRRTRLGVAGVAVAAAAAISLPVVLAGPSGTGAHRAASPAPASAGQSVVTVHYPDRINRPPLVLNPDSGEYSPAAALLGRHLGELPQSVAVSPDLRQVAGTRNTFRLGIASTSGDGAQVVRLPGYGTDPVWSPDSRRIVLGGEPPGRDFRYLDRVVVVEADTGEARAVALAFSAARSGLRDAVSWLDPDHLVVATVDLTDRYPVPGRSAPGPERTPLITGLSVFHLDGSLVRHVPIDQSALATTEEPHAGLMWAPYSEVRHGRVLLGRQPEAGTLELAVLDLGTGELAGEPVSATLPAVPLPDGMPADRLGGFPHTGSHVAHPSGFTRKEITATGEFLRTPLPMAWLYDGTVLLDTGWWRWRSGFEVPAEHYIVDLSTGDMRAVALPVTTTYGVLRVGNAADLAPAAREVAITIP
jgi:hypothetical protein